MAVLGTTLIFIYAAKVMQSGEKNTLRCLSHKMAKVFFSFCLKQAIVWLQNAGDNSLAKK